MIDLNCTSLDVKYPNHNHQDFPLPEKIYNSLTKTSGVHHPVQ